MRLRDMTIPTWPPMPIQVIIMYLGIVIPGWIFSAILFIMMPIVALWLTYETIAQQKKYNDEARK